MNIYKKQPNKIIINYTIEQAGNTEFGDLQLNLKKEGVEHTIKNWLNRKVTYTIKAQNIAQNDILSAFVYAEINGVIYGYTYTNR